MRSLIPLAASAAFALAVYGTLVGFSKADGELAFDEAMIAAAQEASVSKAGGSTHKGDGMSKDEKTDETNNDDEDDSVEKDNVLSKSDLL